MGDRAKQTPNIPGAPALELRNITRVFGPVAGIRAGIRDVSLSLHRGEVVCLLGPSGCGKSTSLRIAAGVERQDAGEVLINGALAADDRCYAPLRPH